MILKIYDRKISRRVEYFNNFNLSLRYDSVASSFGFSFFADLENEEHRILCKIAQYQLARLEHNGELLISAFILSQAITDSATPSLKSFSGYSIPGVLEDSQIPPYAYPLQSDGLTLKQIAEKLMRPFQIKIDIDPSVEHLMNQPYKETTADPTQTVKDYLVELATQKNIIVSHTPIGHLLFTRAKIDQKPIIDFGEGLIADSYNLIFPGQAMHSHIWVMKQADSDGGNAGQSLIENPYVPTSTTAFRPKVIIQSSGDDLDTDKAAQNALASELKNLKLVITVDRWDVNGIILKPNSIVSVQNPRLFMDKKTNWFVEQVDYEGDAEKLTATITCVLPETYSGKYPKYIFS